MHDFNLSPNFKLSEFICKCGSCATTQPIYKLVKMLQELRELYGKKIVITSGVRCREHNAKIGGAPNSYHLYGMAVDIKCHKSHDKYKLLEYAYKVGFTGIGVSSQFLHLDVRGTGERLWTY